MGRISSVDIIRGLVMVIMALDHTRDFFHESALTVNPSDLTQATSGLFLTRLITHLCAPTFVFLSGVSAWLSFQKSRDTGTFRKFLLTRGAWLLVLDFTVINFGLWFDIHFNLLLFNVLATIGFGFILLGLLLKVGSRTLLGLGLGLIFLHNLTLLTSLPSVLTPFFSSAVIPLGGERVFIMGYPPLPWLGILLAGFGAGPFLRRENRKALFLKTGLAALVLFLVLRGINIYGDPAPWQHLETLPYTVMSFLNVTKYPPSLAFTLLTLGVMFLLLGVVENRENRLTRTLEVYGRVPLFYFIVHWYVLHLLLFTGFLLSGYSPSQFVFGSNFGRPADWSGLSLSGVYGVWALLVVIMYPLCKWYGRYKAAHPEKAVLRYL